MTGNTKWFSSGLDPMSSNEYITFGDNSKGKILSHGTCRITDSFLLSDFALVSNLHFNLLSVSQLLRDFYEVNFKNGCCRILDPSGGLVCPIEPCGLVFRAVFEESPSPLRCLIAGPSSDFWKWHRILGHLSFNLLARLSALDLIRGLPHLKFEKDLVCHPC